MNPSQIFQYCTENLDGVVLGENWGEKGIFYNPNNTRKCGVYVLTIKEKDGANDKASRLNRPNVYRLNLGIRKPTFNKLFGSIPARPSAGCTVDMPHDFTALDTILPHPVYAWMSWICVLNPSETTFEQLKPLIQESYDFAVEKFNRSKRK